MKKQPGLDDVESSAQAAIASKPEPAAPAPVTDVAVVAVLAEPAAPTLSERIAVKSAALVTAREGLELLQKDPAAHNGRVANAIEAINALLAELAS